MEKGKYLPVGLEGIQGLYLGLHIPQKRKERQAWK